MKLCKKIFYRTFQKVMYFSIPLLPYREPILLNGNDDIIDVLKKSNTSHVMLVTGKRIRGHGLTAKLEEKLCKNHIKCTIFDETLQKNRLVGDVDFASVEKVAGAITPVPGGVGPMTIAMLMRNTLMAAAIGANADGLA